ncbi:hypothetical protein Bpfe_006345, partial [Biomphalaria pfeifferi]
MVRKLRNEIRLLEWGKEDWGFCKWRVDACVCGGGGAGYQEVGGSPARDVGGVKAVPAEIIQHTISFIQAPLSALTTGQDKRELNVVQELAITELFDFPDGTGGTATKATEARVNQSILKWP